MQSLHSDNEDEGNMMLHLQGCELPNALPLWKTRALPEPQCLTPKTN
jgi:hypothetical protein